MIFRHDTDSGSEPDPLSLRSSICESNERIQKRRIETDRQVLASRIRVARGKPFEQDYVFRSPYGRKSQTLGVDRGGGYQVGACEVANSDRKKTYLHFLNSLLVTRVGY